MLDEHIKEIRKLFQGNRKNTTLVIEPLLNEGQSNEGDYIGNVELSMVRKNDSEKQVNKEGCKYEEFMASQPLRIYGKQHQ